MKIYKTLRSGWALLAIVLLFGLPMIVQGLSWTCPCCHKEFISDPRDPGYFERWKKIHMQACCGKTSDGDSSTSDPRVQVAQQLGSLLGQGLHKLLFGNPEEEARRRQQVQAEALRLKQLEKARRAEEERAKQELYERLSQKLKLSDLEELAPKGFDGDGSGLALKDLNSSSSLEMKLGDSTSKKDDNLRLKGTSFFGLGGDTGASAPLDDINDPMVVDLRNYRRAAFLAEAATLGNPEDAPLLLDEAVKAAQGDKSFVGNAPDSSVIVVNEAGLRAFQEANIAYAKVHDLQIRQTEIFNQAQFRRELAAQAVRMKRAELEKELALKLDKAQLEEIHRLMANIFIAAKAEYEAWVKSKAEMDAVRGREAFERASLIASVHITSIPSPRVPAEIIRREREALEPSFLDRSWHEALKPFGHKWSDELDTYISACYLDFNKPTEAARVNRLVKRIQDLSPYPDDPIRVKIIGQPRDPNVEQGFEKGAWASSDTIYIGSSYLNRQPAPSDDELLFIIGHEMTHIQRDHYIVMNGAIRYEGSRDWVQALFGTEESKWRPEIKNVVRKVHLHDLNYGQELEAMRFGVALGLSAGAKVEGIREYFRQFPHYSGRSQLEELTSDHPPASQYFDALKKIYGDVLGNPWK